MVERVYSLGLPGSTRKEEPLQEKSPWEKEAAGVSDAVAIIRKMASAPSHC